MLVIDGTREDLRYLVTVGPVDLFESYFLLQGRPFKALVQLAHARVMAGPDRPDGVSMSDISSGNASQVIYLLKKQCPPLSKLIWIDTLDRYRLKMEVKDIEWNLDNLLIYPDCEVNRLVREIREGRPMD